MQSVQRQLSLYIAKWNLQKQDLKIYTCQSQAPLFWAFSAPGRTRGDSFMVSQIYWLFKEQQRPGAQTYKAGMPFSAILVSLYELIWTDVLFSFATADQIRKGIFLGWDKER